MSIESIIAIVLAVLGAVAWAVRLSFNVGVIKTEVCGTLKHHDKRITKVETRADTNAEQIAKLKTAG